MELGARFVCPTSDFGRAIGQCQGAIICQGLQEAVMHDALQLKHDMPAPHVLPRTWGSARL